MGDGLKRARDAARATRAQGPITVGEWRALFTADRLAQHDMLLMTGGNVRLSDVRRLAARQPPLMRDAGMAIVADGDGFTIQPVRERQAWALTEEGKAEIERAHAAEKARLDAEVGHGR